MDGWMNGKIIHKQSSFLLLTIKAKCRPETVQLVSSCCLNSLISFWMVQHNNICASQDESELEETEYFYCIWTIIYNYNYNIYNYRFLIFFYKNKRVTDSKWQVEVLKSRVMIGAPRQQNCLRSLSQMEFIILSSVNQNDTTQLRLPVNWFMW